MALTVGDISAVTREKVLGDVIDAAVKNEPTWDFMVENNLITAEGGDEIRRPLLYDRNNSQWHNKRDQLSTNNKDKRTHARYSWRYFSHPINIAKADLRNNTGSGAHRIAGLLESEKQAATEAVGELLGQGIFSDGSNPGGNSTAKQIDGFKAYIGTGTYGDINPSDLPDPSIWKATSTSVKDSNGKLTKSDIQKRILTDINKDFGNKTVDLAICNMAVWSKVWELLMPHQQLMENDTEPGFSSFEWNGQVRFIVDDRAPGSGRGTADNKIYFFRTADLEIVRHEEMGMSMTDFQSPIDQPIIIAFINGQLNFVPRQRKYAGELTGIDPAQ